MQKLDEELLASKKDRLREQVELVTKDSTINVLGFKFSKVGLREDDTHIGFNVFYDNPDVFLKYSDYLNIYIHGWRATSKCCTFHGHGETPEIAILEMQKCVTEDVRYAEKKTEEAVTLLRKARANERRFGRRV